MHQFGATGIPPSRRDTDTRSPLEDDDEEDLINPGSPNTFEDDISEDDVSLDARSPPPNSGPHQATSPSDILATSSSLPLVLDSKPPGSPRPPTLTSLSKDPAKDQERASPDLKDDPETSKSSNMPTSLQSLAPSLTIASLVSSHKRPASPSDHYVTPIRPIPERHVFGYSSMQPMTKRPFTLSPMGPITDRHFLSSAGAFQPIRLQPKQKEET
nr:ESX-1 secretion-associated protein EspI-like [Procambarus clarkii]